MKRINDIYVQFCSIENLMLADDIARRGKRNQPSVMAHDKNRESNIELLHSMLHDGKFNTSPYKVFTIYEPKERVISRLPYFPDRIVHHAVMNILEQVFVSCFTRDTYSCIKGRGIHGAAAAVRRALLDRSETTYCLKLDIKKFYPSVNHDILKELLRKKIKDSRMLKLLDEIIDSAPGLPIGNYLSQYLANFYLSYFDHWVKEECGVRYYFRYADDIVILSSSKSHLHSLRVAINDYMSTRLKLQVKDNYQVFPIASRGLDFVGYRFYHTHTLLRKSIKKNYLRMLKARPNSQSIASYMGWLKHCNSIHLIKKLNNEAV